jgi:cytochrome P450
MWNTHVSGIKHRRRVAGQRAFGSTAEAYSIFEDTQDALKNTHTVRAAVADGNSVSSSELQVMAAKLYGLEKPYHTALRQLLDPAAQERARQALHARLESHGKSSTMSDIRSQQRPSKLSRHASVGPHSSLPFDVQVAMDALSGSRQDGCPAATRALPPWTDAN